MTRKKFIRTDSNRYSKLGRNRKKLQKWRRPKGRDNKIREKRFGYPKLVSVGYKSPVEKSGKIQDRYPLLIYNINDLDRVGKTDNTIIIIGKVGAKKKLEIIKKAVDMNLKIFNVSGGNKNAAT